MRNWISSPLGLGLLLLHAAGCGANGDFVGDHEPADSTEEKAGFEVGAPPAEAAGAESRGDDQSSGEGFDEPWINEVAVDAAGAAAYSGAANDSSDESVEKEKECTVQCSVFGGEQCPDAASGTGNSTGLFGGTCKKACDRAELEAAQSVPTGCVVNCFSEACSSV
jgi:hypothetical protein